MDGFGRLPRFSLIQKHVYAGQGSRSIPAVIINSRHLVSGGRPVAVFENALRQIAAGA